MRAQTGGLGGGLRGNKPRPVNHPPEISEDMEPGADPGEHDL